MKTLRRERGRRVRISAPANPMIFREPNGTVPRVARSKPPMRFKPKRPRRPTPAWVHRVGRNLESLLWFSALGALALSVWFSPLTRLQTLQVVGAPVSVQAELSQAIREVSQNGFTPRTLEQRLQQYGWIARAEWHGVYPGTAQLRLFPRRGVVEVRGPQSEKRYIDPAGFVFTAPKDLPQEPSGTIRVVETQRMPSEGPVRTGEMVRAFAIVRALAEDSRVRHVQVNLHPNGAQVLLLQRATPTAEVMQVRLGDALQWREQVAVVKRLLDVPADEVRQWLYVDLKSPKAPALRLRSASQGGEQ
ncbi:MAG: hypothetical protein SNJ72_03260 [Fimbriimonadales bacterium]